MVNKLIISTLLLLSFTTCSKELEEKNIFSLKIPDASGKIFTGNIIKKYKATVITFMSPDCSLCENYTKTLNDIQSSFSSSDFNFIIVISGTLYSEEKINTFIKNYAVKQIVLLDNTYSMAYILNAAVTPQTYVLNAQGDIMYAGAIDNWVVDIGVKRNIITGYYLNDALHALQQDSTIKIKYTKAIGCYIEGDIK